VALTPDSHGDSSSSRGATPRLAPVAAAPAAAAAAAALSLGSNGGRSGGTRFWQQWRQQGRWLWHSLLAAAAAAAVALTGSMAAAAAMTLIPGGSSISCCFVWLMLVPADTASRRSSINGAACRLAKIGFEDAHVWLAASDVAAVIAMEAAVKELSSRAGCSTGVLSGAATQACH